MTTEERQNRVLALSCAVSLLEGTAGGFSPSERSNAKQTLLGMLEEERQGLLEVLNAQG